MLNEKRVKKYKNKWVALDKKDKIIAADKQLKNAVKKAKTKGFSDPVMIFIAKNMFTTNI